MKINLVLRDDGNEGLGSFQNHAHFSTAILSGASRKMLNDAAFLCAVLKTGYRTVII